MTSLTDAQVAYFDESSPANIEIKMGEAVQTLQNTLTGTVITDITGDVTTNTIVNAIDLYFMYSSSISRFFRYHL